MGVEDVDRQNMKNVIEMLGAQWELKDGVGEFFFLKYMEQVCDRTNVEMYILEDLELLATVLKEMDMTYLIETIEIYDYPSALVLDYLIAE